jgi:membrane protein required for colicin V production
MNWFDIVLIVVLALSTLMGLWRGLISMVFPFIGLIIGVVLAGHYCGTVGGWLPIENTEYAGWAGYAIIIVGILIVTVILAAFLRRFIRLVLLGWVDRLGGAVFGLALGGLLCAAALAASVKFGLGSNFIQDSGIAKLLLDWLPAVLVLLPGDFGDEVREFFNTTLP